MNKDGKGERNGGRDLIYGVGPVAEALRSGGKGITEVFISESRQHGRTGEIRALARKCNLPVKSVPRKVLDEMAGHGANHQGVAAIRTSAGYADANELVSEIAADPAALCLVLDGVEDPHNLGAIIRTAECAGITAVFIPERRSAGLNETVSKTSAGAVEFVKVARVTNVNRLIEQLQDAGFWVVGAAGEADKTHFDWDWSGKIALVLGSEGGGLHRLTREKCDVLVKIPMYGRIGSLNVSVAAGVLMFEARRQREKKAKTGA